MLYKNAEALQRQATAISLSKANRFDDAGAKLHQAVDVITHDERMAGYIDYDVQLAELQRNIGFNLVRQAQYSEEPEYFYQAELQLSIARNILADFVSGKQPRLAVMPQPHGTPKYPRRTINAEHAATLGLQARLGHAITVFGIEATDYLPEEVSKLCDLSGDAHDLSRIGNNGYYRTSINVHGARGAWLNPDQGAIYVGPWLGRISYGLGWTAAWDRPNIVAASQTAARNMPLLRSKEAVEQAVRTSP